MFKCRCVNDNFMSKTGGLMFGNHPLKLHHYLKNYEIHPGLNREYYEITDFKLWKQSDMSQGVKLVTRRKSNNRKIEKKVKINCTGESIL